MGTFGYFLVIFDTLRTFGHFWIHLNKCFVVLTQTCPYYTRLYNWTFTFYSEFGTDGLGLVTDINLCTTILSDTIDGLLFVPGKYNCQHMSAAGLADHNRSRLIGWAGACREEVKHIGRFCL